jgi:hypothetical protein
MQNKHKLWSRERNAGQQDDNFGDDETASANLESDDEKMNPDELTLEHLQALCLPSTQQKSIIGRPVAKYFIPDGEVDEKLFYGTVTDFVPAYNIKYSDSDGEDVVLGELHAMFAFYAQNLNEEKENVGAASQRGGLKGG